MYKALHQRCISIEIIIGEKHLDHINHNDRLATQITVGTQ
jgi:hypothetical protein